MYYFKTCHFVGIQKREPRNSRLGEKGSRRGPKIHFQISGMAGLLSGIINTAAN